MKALLLLLVLVGMAKVGWGQIVQVDTVCNDIDTFVKIKKEYFYYDSIEHSSNGKVPILYKLCNTQDSNLWLGFFIGFKYYALRNKALNKSYFQRGMNFGFNTRINNKYNLGFGMDLFLNDLQILNMAYDFGLPEDYKLDRVFSFEFLYTRYLKIKRNFNIEIETGYKTGPFYPRLKDKENTTAQPHKEFIRKNTIHGLIFRCRYAYYFQTGRYNFRGIFAETNMNYQFMTRINPQLSNFVPYIGMGAFMTIVGTTFIEHEI